MFLKWFILKLGIQKRHEAGKIAPQSWRLAWIGRGAEERVATDLKPLSRTWEDILAKTCLRDSSAVKSTCCFCTDPGSLFSIPREAHTQLDRQLQSL
ncbi:hypothetical protein ACRRTK_019822 [Alexandromys fortis]